MASTVPAREPRSRGRGGRSPRPCGRPERSDFFRGAKGVLPPEQAPGRVCRIRSALGGKGQNGAMTVPPAWNPSPEALLAEHAWAQRLARRLVRDAALAEDLAQEATVRALGREPGPGLRAWLGGVVRNLA